MSEHAISNARGWLDTIVGAMTSLEALNEGAESAEFDGETFTDADAVRQRIHEGPLSVEVRSDWHTPGVASDLGEFRILLSTGGPALQLTGELDEHGQPYGQPVLQWQDWGTPWTTYYDTTDDEDEALKNYACEFYFGE